MIGKWLWNKRKENRKKIKDKTPPSLCFSPRRPNPFSLPLSFSPAGAKLFFSLPFPRSAQRPAPPAPRPSARSKPRLSLSRPNGHPSSVSSPLLSVWRSGHASSLADRWRPHGSAFPFFPRVAKPDTASNERQIPLLRDSLPKLHVTRSYKACSPPAHPLYPSTRLGAGLFAGVPVLDLVEPRLNRHQERRRL